MFALIGHIITTINNGELKCFKGFVVVENGKIVKVGELDELESFQQETSACTYNVLRPTQFIIPGFVDVHVHAPQFPNLGLGLDRPLLEWLDRYTFPTEMQFEDPAYARRIYDSVVKTLLRHGTTTACYFGSLSLNGTLELAQAAGKWSQRAFVGKVSMNRENKHGYFNDTAKEIKETELFIQKVLEMKNDLIQPIITPRFAISCDMELMTALSALAHKYKCRIQTHISENKSEIELISHLYPTCKTYTDVYDQCGILTEKTILAHAVHLTQPEIDLIKKRGAAIAHCPASNTRLMSGMCNIDRLRQSGITCGLGTDVSGGDSVSILDTMRRSLDVSAHLKMFDTSNDPISWKEAFYTATLGGAKALGIDDVTGSLEAGKDFDALVIEAYPLNGALQQFVEKEESIIDLFMRYFYTGDDRNIENVYVKGKNILFEKNNPV